MTSGLGCDGDTVAMTAATNPSLEDLLRGCFPGMPPVILYNPFLAYETGEEFMRAWFAAAGELDPFILVLEGSVPNDAINGDGHWATFGVDPQTGEPIPTAPGSIAWRRGREPCSRSARAPPTAGSRRCATTQPARWGCVTTSAGTGARGSAFRSSTSRAVRSSRTTSPRRCSRWLYGWRHRARSRPRRAGPTTTAVRPHRARGLRSRGFAEQGQFSESHGDGRCLVKLGCQGPVVKCNVPTRGWVGGIGGCPNVGGICMACTMPGFPDKYMPFVETGRAVRLYTSGARLSNGPLLRYFRERSIRRNYDIEPDWRQPGEVLTSGYQRG
jgi:hydrogenase small subunit